jgi:hypothetical protein
MRRVRVEQRGRGRDDVRARSFQIFEARDNVAIAAADVLET